jgi:predicted Zn finger-like uncharacterized protein
MFTRCPACRTVFHITAAELRAADGTVICGACDSTFDALDSLSETRPADVPEDETPASLPGEEEAWLATARARDEDEFLEELESLIGDDGMPGQPLGAHHQPGAAPPEERPDAGESGPDDFPDDLPDDLPDGVPDDLPDDLPDGVPEEVPDTEPEDEFPDPDSVFRIDDPPQDFDAPTAGPFVGDDDERHPAESLQDGKQVGMPGDEAPASAAVDTGRIQHELHVPEEHGEAEAEPPGEEHVPGFVLERRRGGLWLRVLLPLAAVLVLAGTWAHVQRGKLLRLPAGEAVLAPIYSMLRMDVSPDWSPGEFRVLRSEAVATADRPGNLRVAIEFLNSAAFAQPYPVIRIVLQDRFGRRLESHDMAPAQYLESYTPGARLPAEGRIQTSVTVPDPGARADGFRVDLCLELDARGLVCAAEPFR